MRDRRWLQGGAATVAGTAATALLVGSLADVTNYYWIQLGTWASLTLLLAAGTAAIVNRSFTEREAMRNRLMLQEEVAVALAQAEDVEEQTAEILKVLGHRLNFALCVAWQVADRDETLRAAGTWSSPVVDATDFRRDTERVRFRKGDGVLGLVWQSGQAVLINDIQSDSRLRRAELLESLRLPSVMFVPVRQRGEVTGVIECFSTRRIEPDKDLLDQLERIGDQVGVAFDRGTRTERLEESEERHRHVLGAMLRAEEDAKAKLAADLHDDTIQVLTATLLSLDRLANASDAGDFGRLTEAAATARTTLREAVERTRLVMFGLRPHILTELGIAEATRILVEDAARDCEFSWVVEADIGRYNRSLENLVYRTLQEAVSNVRKHAHADRVSVEIREFDGWLHGKVKDDGRGFELEHALDRNRMRLHLGLGAMRERISMAGGELLLDSDPGRGTRLSFRLPLAAIADPDDAGAPAGGSTRRRCSWRSDS